ncbi:MAG: hypothetical protein ABSG56_26935 [Bryobacteraceae bacterium]|jgi:hypothetical protein
MNGSNPQLAQLSPKPLSGQSHGTAPVVSVNLRGRVTKIDTITGPSQSALTVFPLPFCPGTAPQPTPNLNVPGPQNDTKTGACFNIFQIHFHLAGIDSRNVNLIRIVDRTTVIGGQTNHTEKSDGPSGGDSSSRPLAGCDTVATPSDSLIAVVDSPGAQSSGHPNPAAFPLSYHAHFILSAHDSMFGNAVLAKISYDVIIDKQAIDDPNPTNTFSVTDQQIF